MVCKRPACAVSCSLVFSSIPGVSTGNVQHQRCSWCCSQGFVLPKYVPLPPFPLPFWSELVLLLVPSCLKHRHGHKHSFQHRRKHRHARKHSVCTCELCQPKADRQYVTIPASCLLTLLFCNMFDLHQCHVGTLLKQICSKCKGCHRAPLVYAGKQRNYFHVMVSQAELQHLRLANSQLQRKLESQTQRLELAIQQQAHASPHAFSPSSHAVPGMPSSALLQLQQSGADSDQTGPQLWPTSQTLSTSHQQQQQQQRSSVQGESDLQSQSQAQQRQSMPPSGGYARSAPPTPHQEAQKFSRIPAGMDANSNPVNAHDTSLDQYLIAVFALYAPCIYQTFTHISWNLVQDACMVTVYYHQ